MMPNTNNVIEQVIERLTVRVTLNSGFKNVIDVSLAKELFKALRAHDIDPDFMLIRDAAINHGWPLDEAQELAELARKIGNGGVVQIPHKTGWGERVVKEALSLT